MYSEIGFLDGYGELLLRGGPQSIAQRAVGVHAIRDSGLRQATVLQVSSAVLLDSRRKYGLLIYAQTMIIFIISKRGIFKGKSTQKRDSKAEKHKQRKT